MPPGNKTKHCSRRRENPAAEESHRPETIKLSQQARERERSQRKDHGPHVAADVSPRLPDILLVEYHNSEPRRMTIAAVK